MTSHIVCYFVLLLSEPCLTSMVRRMGCMVEIGKEETVVKERILGLPAPKGQQEGQWRGPFHSLVGDAINMTVQFCVDECWLQRYTFAALQGGSRCYCGQSKQDLTNVDVSLCSERCSGNCRQRCGGNVALSVYHTGYEREPKLPDANLARGLLGCFLEDSWRGWCGWPKSAGTMGQRRQKGEQQLPQTRAPKPDEVVMASLKPPLVSKRMSVLMCATYCASGSQSKSLAILRAEDTCCCGQPPQNHSAPSASKVLFSEHCKDPCADSTSSPACVGTVDGKSYISVYKTIDIWPLQEQTPKEFPLKRAWHQPIFPADDKFEVSLTNAKWRQPELEELSGVHLFLPIVQPLPPVIDPINFEPSVMVVDVPEEEECSNALVWLLCILPFLCLLIFVAILVYFVRRKKNKGLATNDDRDKPRKGRRSSEATRNQVMETLEKAGQQRKGQSDETYYFSSSTNKNRRDRSANRCDGNEAPTYDSTGSKTDWLLSRRALLP